ncbi:chemotaxis protein CheW [Nostoc sp. FACHB-280]|uniref:chemotaxis protein CheW n=1 Tax=Nostoc sp. FACHB-280 TaxID=2692839 RepID=UPI00168A9A38|nr:chemotaxis protein CheW [Nostoc sp. FACHB-280]MBD2496109.1 chemotaxis protein CheW [Nostoc sp. FACHB-280]
MTTQVESCWNVIGIEGDRTCAELSTHTHCRNCPVYSAAGRCLLERPTPENYRREWTHLIAESPAQKKPHLPTYAVRTSETLTVVIFRLHQEWLALPAQVFKETTPPSVIHTLPHRQNQVLRGLINIRGELLLCVSLSHFLNIEPSESPLPGLSPVSHSRMAVIEKAGNAWVFPVDEIYGVHRFHRRELRDVVRNVTQITQTYTKGLFSWQPLNLPTVRTVSYLDDELLFTNLAKKAQ